MAVRLKVVCTELVERRYGGYTQSKNDRIAGFKFQPVTGNSPENKAFFDSTPTGLIEFQSVHVSQLDEFKVGGEYYVTIEYAPPHVSVAR